MNNINFQSEIYLQEDPFQLILDAINKFDYQRFIYGIKYKHWDKNHVINEIERVSKYTHKLKKEYDRLVNFAQDFNKQFATEDNGCFITAQKMLKKMKSGISSFINLLLKYCPRRPKNEWLGLIRNPCLRAFDYSRIVGDKCQLTFFTLDDYPECVSMLYNAMETFFYYLNRSLQLCKQVIADESNIRKDKKYCKFLWEECKKKVWKEMSCFYNALIFDSECFSDKNPAICKWKASANDEEWAVSGFHKFSLAEIKPVVVKEVHENNINAELTKEEINLFGLEVQTVKRIRKIIQHFDVLVEKPSRKNRIPPMLIRYFLHYIRIKKGSLKEAVAYFTSTYNAVETKKYKTVSYTAVSNCKVKLDDNPEYKNFVKTLEMHFPCSSVQPEITIGKKNA